MSQGSQDMAYWHDWWNHLSGFQRQLILLVSTVDDFWNSLTEGQRTATGRVFKADHLFFYEIVFTLLSPAGVKPCSKTRSASSSTRFTSCFLGIIAINAAVLCCWRIPSMQRTMMKYFMSNPASSEFNDFFLIRCWKSNIKTKPTFIFL